MLHGHVSPDWQSMNKADFQRVLHETSDITHCRLLVQLLVLAYVDGHVAVEELELLRNLAAALKVEPMMVDILVDRLQHGEEPVF